MIKNITTKHLFIAARTLVTFFIMVWLNAYVIKSSAVIIGVLQELLLIPMMLLQILILGIASHKIFQTKITLKGMLFWTIVMMVCSILLTFGSFII
jgi:hypothetical protein